MNDAPGAGIWLQTFLLVCLFQTGHLVFSTLHTNDTSSSFTRLIDIGIKPFLVASGVRAILEKEIAALQKNPPCPLPPIHLRRGAGAYNCGEETAMIE